MLKTAGVDVQFGIFHNEVFGTLYKSLLLAKQRDLGSYTHTCLLLKSLLERSYLEERPEELQCYLTDLQKVGVYRKWTKLVQVNVEW